MTYINPRKPSNGEVQLASARNSSTLFGSEATAASMSSPRASTAISSAAAAWSVTAYATVTIWAAATTAFWNSHRRWRSRAASISSVSGSGTGSRSDTIAIVWMCANSGVTSPARTSFSSVDFSHDCKRRAQFTL